MKELKTYISEGFFSNVGANNPIKPVIDAIKDASINDKIKSDDKRLKFRDSLAVVLKDLEIGIKKGGKLTFEYIRNIGNVSSKITISLEITKSNYARWIYSDEKGNYENDAYYIAFNIASDLYYGTKYPTQDPKLRHSIANTIKVIEFKLS